MIEYLIYKWIISPIVQVWMNAFASSLLSYIQVAGLNQRYDGRNEFWVKMQIILANKNDQIACTNIRYMIFKYLLFNWLLFKVSVILIVES